MRKLHWIAFALLSQSLFVIRPVIAEPSLLDSMLALDSTLFDSFNRCQEPGQLDLHARHFDAEVEFYHDNGGVTWNREDMIANTKKFVCGNFTRQLVPDTFSAHPIKDFGAITKGVHRFCQSDSDRCEGEAEFIMIWHNRDNEWRITRALSFGHRASASP